MRLRGQHKCNTRCRFSNQTSFVCPVSFAQRKPVVHLFQHDATGTRLLLIDAAQLDDAEFAQLSDLQGGRSLYADLGGEASRVGPWIAPCDESGGLEKCIFNRDGKPNHYLSLLDSDTSQSTVENHLQQLRIMVGPNGARYFFRFADTRALITVYESVSADARRALIGPITEWHYWSRSGAKNSLCTMTALASATLPLALTPASMRKIIQASRPDQLMSEIREIRPDTLEPLSGSEAHEIAKSVCNYLRTHRISENSARLAIGIVTFKTKGRVLHDEEFERQIKATNLARHPDSILDWPDNTSCQVPA